jgi:hypothetical protein
LLEETFPTNATKFVACATKKIMKQA